MAEKTPREKALATVRDVFNKRSMRNIPALPSTSAMYIQDSEDALWQNNAANHENPENEVPEHQQTTQNQESDEEEMGLLTQYIGPARGQISNKTTKTATSENIELEKLKKTFAEATDIIDRANNHKSFLEKAVRTEKIPPKLKISIKPLIMKKDDPSFQISWNTAVKSAEESLVKCLIDHLDTILTQTNEELRASTKETLSRLKRLNPIQEAKDKIKETLDQAQDERTQRNNNRAKRKLEANKSKESKKAKTTTEEDK
ncbi:MAG: hypothetical protein OXC53_07200 [Rhodobacteraceae bacterium]|nr:hypothetical protein [Paracoccaceae bacterium]